MSDKRKREQDELRDHYDIDFSKAKPNPYAAMFGSLKPGGRVVYLEPEVAERFTTSEDVNRVLKTLVEIIPAVPKSKNSKRKRTKPAKPARSPGRATRI